MSRDTWKHQVLEAQRWLSNIPDDVEMKMVCEVQMALREYGKARTQMHELYKIVRSSGVVALHKEFAKYERAYRGQKKFDADGSTDFGMACRDGLDIIVNRLLPQTSKQDIRKGFLTACEHVRPQCVKAILDYDAAHDSQTQSSTSISPVRFVLIANLFRVDHTVFIMSLSSNFSVLHVGNCNTHSAVRCSKSRNDKYRWAHGL